jgi:hypothetical protein
MTAVGWAYASFGVLFGLLGFGAWRIALTGGSILAGGALFLIAGPYARRRRTWAIWLGIGTALLTGVALALLLALLVGTVGWRDLLAIRSVAWTALALLLLVFILVHGMIVWNLSNAFDLAGAPHAAALDTGFEPVVPASPRPVLPTEQDDYSTATR